MSVINPIHDQLDADVHWLTRSDLTPMLSTHPKLHKIWSYEKKTGLIGLFKIVSLIRKENFDYVYDAHQNIRSNIVRVLLGFPNINPKYKFAVRLKHRIRRLLFFQANMKSMLKMPFRAVRSFQDPIAPWGIDLDKTYDTQWIFNKELVAAGEKLLNHLLDEEKVITLVPSAAWELKRWPVEYWKQLVVSMPDYKFVILAGPNDDFTKEIEKAAPERIVNLAGKSSLLESFYIISQSQMVVSADTGFLHAADLFRRNAIALMGPTAFGHPTGDTVKVLEINNLECRPCTKAGNTTCKLADESRNCLLDIKPLMVKQAMKETFNIH